MLPILPPVINLSGKVVCWGLQKVVEHFLGGKMRNITFQFVLQQLQNKLHVFVACFTVGLTFPVPSFILG